MRLRQLHSNFFVQLAQYLLETQDENSEICQIVPKMLKKIIELKISHIKGKKSVTSSSQ